MKRLPLAVMMAVGFAGCAIRYEPARVLYPHPLTGAEFDLVAALLRQRYGGLPVEDRASFRLQTEWVPFQRGAEPGKRRATVYRDVDRQLRVLVEIRYIRIGFGGLPETTPSAGDIPAEEELAGALERALGSKFVIGKISRNASHREGVAGG